jgi:hypothetical protein
MKGGRGKKRECTCPLKMFRFVEELWIPEKIA